MESMKHLEAYSMARTFFTMDITAMYRRLIRSKESNAFAKEYFDVPKIMTQLLTDEDIDLDILVLIEDDKMLIDCGLHRAIEASAGEYSDSEVRNSPSFKPHILDIIRSSSIKEIGSYQDPANAFAEDVEHLLQGDLDELIAKGYDEGSIAAMKELRPILEKTDFFAWYFRFLAKPPRIYVIQYGEVESPSDNDITQSARQKR